MATGQAEQDGATTSGELSQTSGESCRVGVRVPPFYPEKPALWFAQLEGQFALSNITADTTKYYHTIAQLGPQYAAEVEDIITSPPKIGMYDKLKEELVKRLSASREKKVKQLLDHEQIGYRKPSQFVRHLQNLAGPGVPEDFLRTIWTSRLPQGTQTIIASQPKATLADLAELADRVHDVVSVHPQVASTSNSTPTPNVVAAMERQIAALTEQVRALSSEVQRSRSDRDRSNSRSRQDRRTSRTRSPAICRRYPLCWYHGKFGDKAKNCVKPCDYAGNGPSDR